MYLREARLETRIPVRRALHLGRNLIIAAEEGQFKEIPLRKHLWFDNNPKCYIVFVWVGDIVDWRHYRFKASSYPLGPSFYSCSQVTAQYVCHQKWLAQLLSPLPAAWTSAYFLSFYFGTDYSLFFMTMSHQVLYLQYFYPFPLCLFACFFFKKKKYIYTALTLLFQQPYSFGLSFHTSTNNGLLQIPFSTDWLSQWRWCKWSK